MVCDEIQSGTGRTGKWFAYEHFGVVPDITVVSKGLASGMPLGAVIASKGIMNWPPGAQGSTFGGNPVACAAAVATLDLVEKQYLANAAAMGKVLLAKLNDIAQKHKSLTNPRGIGLMCGLDVVDAATRDKIVVACFQRGLIMLGCGEKTLRFCPALCITQQELETGLKLLEEAVASVS